MASLGAEAIVEKKMKLSSSWGLTLVMHDQSCGRSSYVDCDPEVMGKFSWKLREGQCYERDSQCGVVHT